MAQKALRVLAAACKAYEDLPQDVNSEKLWKQFNFRRACRNDWPCSPWSCWCGWKVAKSAGIKAVMITGDHKDTAVAIGKQLNIIANETEAITGAELDQMSEEKLKRIIYNISVYARVQPDHKVRIVECFKSLGKIVAMTGDGVNDAPALKNADIGISMGLNGTDVAKNASDMILTDDNFVTIVEAVKHGRNIFDNIKKSGSFFNLQQI